MKIESKPGWQYTLTKCDKVSNSNPDKVHVDIELFSYDFKILNPRTFVSLQVTMESRLQASWAMLILLVGSTVAGSSDDFAKIRELTLSAECPIGAFLKSVFQWNLVLESRT